MNNFVNILGSDINNIKIVNNFLNFEDKEELLNLAKMGDKKYNGNLLHVPALKYIQIKDLAFLNKINNQILNSATKQYKMKFNNKKINFGLNIHKVNSFTDPHVDIIENTPGPQIPGKIEPEYPDWRNSWDGYLACNVYLNDDYEGGEVYFPEKDNFTIKPKANSLIMWPGNKYFIHGISKTLKNNRYVYGVFIKFADYDKYSL